jgi:hypothetical protein
MVKKKKNTINNSWFYLSIVVIVAIVGIVMVVNSSSDCDDFSDESIVELTDEEGNIIGEAFMLPKSKYSTTKRFQLKSNFVNLYSNLKYEAQINPLFLRCLAVKKKCILEEEFSVGETKTLELEEERSFQLKMTQMNDFGAYFSYVGGGGILFYQLQCQEMMFGQNKVSLLSYSYSLDDTSSNKAKVCVY